MSQISALPNSLILAAALGSLIPISCATEKSVSAGTALEAGEEWNPPVVALRSAPTLHDALSQFDDRRVIFVGETHTRYDHHLVQLEVLKFLHRRHGNVAVGVEWFQFPFQQAIDDYFAGAISEAEMLERTGYYERWRFDYRLYRPIVEYAREQGIPLIALNAPRELTQAIGDAGIDGLTADLKDQLPAEYDRSDQAYASRLRQTFDHHPGAGRDFERFLDVQLTWDETMAERAAKHLTAHPDRRMAIFAGSGHIAHGSGIPGRLARRIDSEGAILLVGMERPLSPDAADFVVLTEPRELPPGGLLGAFLEATDQGVKIVGLSENSAIGEAGMKKDDVLLAIDDRPTPSFSAVKLALLDRTPGDKVTVRYRHGTAEGAHNEHTIEVELRGAAPRQHP